MASRRRTGTPVTLLVAAALAFGCGGEARHEPPEVVGVGAGQAIDRYLTMRTEMGQFSGAALVAQQGQILLRRGYGFADVEKRVPFTPATPQPVASISKMFTARATLELRDAGALRLDDSICEHLPDCPSAWRAVTVAHLMHHRSGIPDYESRIEMGSSAYFDLMSQPGASATIVEDAKQRPLDFPPGQQFRYSNTGYIVLSYIVERVSGRTFADFVRAHVLAPAGMDRSGFVAALPGPIAPATGYTYGDLGWSFTLQGAPLTSGHLTPVPALALSAPQGDAWLVSTVDDLYRFSRTIEGSDRASLAEVEDGYGCGWVVDTAFERPRMRHNGILPGFVSEFHRFPDDKLSIIVLSNLDRARMGNIARDLTAIALGEPFDMPVRGSVVTLTDAQLAGLLGSYRTTEGLPLTVRKEPDYVVAELEGHYQAGLIPMSPTEMYFPMADGRAIFTLGPDGRATQLNMRYRGEDHVATPMER